MLLSSRRRQQFEALREQGEALREARAAADSTMESRGAQIASATALSVLLKGFKTLDKDRSGRLHEGEFAAVLKHASLGLSHQEVHTVYWAGRCKGIWVMKACRARYALWSGAGMSR